MQKEKVSIMYSYAVQEFIDDIINDIPNMDEDDLDMTLITLADILWEDGVE